MQLILLVQKVIILLSGPILPLAIGALFIPAAQGSAQNILRSIVGVLCWPLGWGFASIGTTATLNLLQAPLWGSNPGSIIAAVVPFGLVCIWMVITAIGAPFLISGLVTRGTNAIAGMVG